VARRAMDLRACALPHFAPLLRRLRRNPLRRSLPSGKKIQGVVLERYFAYSTALVSRITVTRI
jgi:hypothetical protein